MTSRHLLNPRELALGVALSLTVAVSSCFPVLTGAPCSSNANCPTGQFCAANGACELGTGGPAGDGGGVNDAGASGDAGKTDAGGVTDGGGFSFDAGTGEANRGSCFDGLDNDNDGLTDCADAECAGQACRPSLGVCDPIETCVAGSNSCPADVFSSNTTRCGAPASCSGGMAVGPSFCNGQGSCSPQPSMSCEGYRCNGTVCRTSCSGDIECLSTHFCSSSVCVPKQANGVACTAANQCGSSNCVDMRCCDSTCTGGCETCNNSSGTCTPAAPGTDPRNSCGLNACDGSGACATSCTEPPVCANPGCSASAICVSSVCVVKKLNGADCVDDCECQAGVCTSYFSDGDGDTYGTGSETKACGAVNRPGFATRDGDCNDADPMVNPAAIEVPGDGEDQDCDKFELCFVDEDQDGYRTADQTITVPSDFIDCSVLGLALGTLPAGDRCDVDKDARPNQVLFSASKTNCRTYDWNSDGTEELEFRRYSCSALVCQAGYVGGVACGDAPVTVKACNATCTGANVSASVRCR